MENWRADLAKRFGLNTLDLMLSKDKIDAQAAFVLRKKEVAELAREYTTAFNEIATLLRESREYASKTPAYVDYVKSGASRDSCYLSFNPNMFRLPANAIQARMDIEGISDAAYLSVREQLLSAQESYKKELADLKTFFSQAKSS